MPPKKKYNTTNQPHSGAATIRPPSMLGLLVAGSLGRRSAAAVELIHAPDAEREHRRQSHHDRAAEAEERRRQHRPRGELRVAWQAVGLGLVHQQVEGVQAAKDLIVGAIELRFGVAIAL